MEYRVLGRTGLNVSTICLGTMQMGTKIDEATSFAILDRFVEAGGTFIDTANNYSFWDNGYGRDSEDVIGHAPTSAILIATSGNTPRASSAAANDCPSRTLPLTMAS